MENQYRLRPVTVEAHQYLGTEQNIQFMKEWSNSAVFEASEHRGRVYAHTPDGVMVLNVQDWLIKGANGHFSVMRPDAFAEIYEKV